jgi:hypothetical protein
VSPQRLGESLARHLVEGLLDVTRDDVELLARPGRICDDGRHGSDVVARTAALACSDLLAHEEAELVAGPQHLLGREGCRQLVGYALEGDAAVVLEASWISLLVEVEHLRLAQLIWEGVRPPPTTPLSPDALFAPLA